MVRRFALDLAFLLMANLLVKPAWILGIDRMVQNTCGPEAYGTYFALFNFSFLFSVIVDAGINNFNNRAISRNPSRAPEYLFNLFFIKWILGIVFISITLFAGFMIGFTGSQLYLLFLLCLIHVMMSLTLFNRSGIASLHHFRTDALISVSDKFFAILICGGMLWGLSPFANFSILDFAYAQLIALAITVGISGAFLMRKAKPKFKLWNGRMMKAVLFKSFPFAVLSLLMTAYYRLDAVMIERMLGDQGALQAGIYAASYRLLDAVNMFAYLFSTLLLPIFSDSIRRKENPNQLANSNAALLLSGSMSLAVLSLFYGEEILHLLYTNADAQWVPVFQWLMASFVPIAMSYVFGTLLTAHGNLKMLNLIALLGLGVNLALNLWLIPQYTSAGAAFATFVTQWLVTLAGFYVSIRKHGHQPDGKLLLVPFLCAGLTALVCFFLTENHSLSAHGLWIAGVLAGALCLLFNFGFFQMMVKSRAGRPQS